MMMIMIIILPTFLLIFVVLFLLNVQYPDTPIYYLGSCVKLGPVIRSSR